MDGLNINSSSVLTSSERYNHRNKGYQDISSSFECSKQSILNSMKKFVHTVQSMRGTILVPSKLRDMRLRPRLPDSIFKSISNTAGGKSASLFSTNTTLDKENHHNSFYNHQYHTLHNHLNNRYHSNYHHISSHHHSRPNQSSNLRSGEDCKSKYGPTEVPSALVNADLYSFYFMLFDIKKQLLWGPTSGQSTIYTNTNYTNINYINRDLNSNYREKNLNSSSAASSILQLNNSIASCSLSSNKENCQRAESTCSSGYSSNSSTCNSTNNLNYFAHCNSPTNADKSTNVSFTNIITNSNSNINNCNRILESIQSRPTTISNTNEKLDTLNTSTVGSDIAQSKSPSDSDLESELDSVSTDRTEQITDQTQLLASAFRHHLQALHTILDQLTHSAEYLSRNYELDLDESNS